MAPVRSGQITVTTAGTAVAGPSTTAGSLFMLQGHPDNTDVVWIGNDGSDDVTNLNGYSLAAGETIPVSVDDDLSELRFDADVSGEKICWFKLTL